MKKNLLLALALSLYCAVFAQTPQIGTPEWAALHSQYQRNGGPLFSPQNGNDTLNNIYNNTACGLTYSMNSVRLGQRFIPIGSAQPAPINVSIPACAVIDKAYLYTEALGVASSITANITNPSSVSTSYNMSLIGSSIDVCWQMNGTHVWRADVTSCITGPGTYLLSGFPTTTIVSNNTVDVEGATLIIIYSDPSASYTGTLIIDDGCRTYMGGNLVHTMNGFSACANSTYANSFMLVGDMQMTGYTLSMNGNPVVQPAWNWWNEISATSSVTSGQNTCNFSIDHGGDCYTLAVAGLYFQTGCQTCTPVVTNMTTTTSSTANTCGGNGTATVNVSGGSGNYTYYWSPSGQTTATATNLTGGTYTVNISDGLTCTTATVSVANTSPVLTFTSSSSSSCLSNGSASVSISGGVGPYSYSWSSGGTAATETGLATGTYTVTVTDNGTGCVLTGTVLVANMAPLSVYAYSSPDNCNSPAGSVWVSSISGGQAPYTYVWMPGGYTTPTVSNLYAGTYTVTVTDANGCTDTAQTTVGNINSNTMFFTSPLQPIACSDSAQLYVYCSDTSATFTWSPALYLDNPNIQFPYCSAQVPMTYTVTGITTCGLFTDTVQIVLDSNNYFNEEICFVTVDTAANKNIVTWERWNSPSTGFYNVYRETSILGVYAIVGTQPVSQFTTFIDMTSNPQVMADRYMITTVDTCGNESDTSYHHRTIHLQTSPTGNGGFNLSWTAYEGLPILTYNIYRGASISTLTLLTQVAGNVFTYTDLTPPPGQNYYFIEAVHPFGGCNPSRMAQGSSALAFSNSNSNIAVATPDGIADASFENSLVVSPNPGNGNFQLSMSLNNAQEIEIIVYDNLGRNVFAKQQNANAGTFTTSMNLEGFSQGVYLVQVKTATGTATRRLVIE